MRDYQQPSHWTVLVHSAATTQWHGQAAHQQQRFISYGSRDWLSSSVMVGRGPSSASQTPLYSTWRKERRSSGPSFIRGLISFRRAPPSWPNHLSHARPIKKVGISTFDFWRDTDFQTVALTYRASLRFKWNKGLTLHLFIIYSCVSSVNETPTGWVLFNFVSFRA